MGKNVTPIDEHDNPIREIPIAGVVIQLDMEQAARLMRVLSVIECGTPTIFSQLRDIGITPDETWDPKVDNIDIVGGRFGRGSRRL